MSKKAPHKNTQQKPKACPLSDPTIGMIPENDHHVGLCLCRFCTCKGHICVANKAPNPYLSSTFATKYKQEYRSKNFDVPLRAEPERYTPNKQKMDFLTTNKLEYRPVMTELRKSTQSENKRLNHELLDRSAYCNDYPNWGPYMVVREKRWHPPVRSTELRFLGTSSYNRSFQPRSSSTPETQRPVTAEKSHMNLCKGQFLYGHTTYKRTMDPKRNLNTNARVKPIPPQHERISASPHHFGTTNQQFYYPRPTSEMKDPKTLKYQLILNNR